MFTCLFLYLVCADPLGLEEGKMSLTASSYYSNGPASYARLNHYRGWSPTHDDNLVTLKIDFGIERRVVSAVAVQSGTGYSVSAYELYYSVDGLSWRHFVENAHEKVLRLQTFSHVNEICPEMHANEIHALYD